MATWNDIGDGLAQALDYANGVASGVASDISDAFDEAAVSLLAAVSCPIVLDLDGDGIELTPLAGSKTYFDIDNDLFAERTGWVKADDGLLVRDLNGNGQIDNQGELFGDNDGTSAYAKLAALDTNKDGKVSGADAGFAALRIWQDKNQDGHVDAGELKTLAAAGITSLGTTTVAGGGSNQGHAIAATSNFIRTGGTTGQAADVLFQNNNVDSWYVGNGTAASRPLDMEALFMPLSRGYGKLPSFTDAFSQNAGLKTLALDLMDDRASQLKPSALQGKIETFLFTWAGVTGVSATSRGNYIDARKLAFLEKLLDQPFVDRLGSHDPNSSQAVSLMKAWDGVFAEVESRLLLQGPLAFSVPVHYQNVDDRLAFDAPLSQIMSQLAADAPTASADKFNYWQAVGTALNGQHEGLGVTAAALSQAIDNAAGYPVLTLLKSYIEGTSAADTMNGTSASEYIYGLDGNDSLSGGPGGDILLGGKGNDSLSGGGGDDTFIIARAEGSDTLTGGLDFDTLAFGSGITFSNITLARVGQTYDLRIGLPGGTSVLVKEAFSTNAVETYRFADGTTKTLSDMAIATTARAATDGNDTIYGFNENETINAKKGNDYVDAGDGNDTITVNTGDGLDTIIGGGGFDVLSFGPNISWPALQFAGNGHSKDLTITVPGGSKIFSPDFFGNGAIETLKFSDGSQKTFNAVAQAISASAGTIGNDTIYGFDINETITGGKGNDYMEGGYGDDTFVISQGDGIDTIEGFVGNDTVIFGSGITFSSLQLSHPATNELLAKLPGGGSLSLWKSYGGEIEFYRFQGDAHTYTSAELKNKAMAQAATSGNDSIVGFSYNDDIINGLGGNDTLYGDWGNDTLTGGAGIDRLTGDLGLDVFDYNSPSDSTKTAADTITDFNTADDKIDLRGLGFTGIASGAATGAKLGYVYDAAANDTVITAISNFKLVIDGYLTLDATDFVFS